MSPNLTNAFETLDEKGLIHATLLNENNEWPTLFIILALKICEKKDMSKSMKPLSFTSRMALVLLGMAS